MLTAHSVCFFIHDLPRVVLFPSQLGSLHQSVIKKTSHRLAHWPIFQRHFPSQDPSAGYKCTPLCLAVDCFKNCVCKCVCTCATVRTLVEVRGQLPEVFSIFHLVEVGSISCHCSAYTEPTGPGASGRFCLLLASARITDPCYCVPDFHIDARDLNSSSDMHCKC